MLEQLLSICFEAGQNSIDALESEDSDAGGVDIQGYLSKTVLQTNKLDPSSDISDGMVIETLMLLWVLGTPYNLYIHHIYNIYIPQ